MAETPDVFPYLAIGLVEFARNGFRFPYPASLQYAFNHLSLRLILQRQVHLTAPLLPPDLPGKLRVFQLPLGEWWPATPERLPDEIDPELPLLQAPLTDENAVDEQVMTYLADVEIPQQATLQRLAASLAQGPIVDLLEWARQDPAQREEEYRTVRRYLIDYPYVTLDEFEAFSMTLRYLDQRLFGSCYEFTERNDPQLRHKGSYWSCPHCKGLLMWDQGRPRCAKRLCGAICPDYQGMQPVAIQPGMRRLNFGIHTRVCVPGITEVRLHDAFQGEGIQATLWPSVDRYDIQVRLPGACWAIDVKDYESPRSLAYHIRHHLLRRFEGNSELEWDRAFYVVPAYRVMLLPTYVSQLRQALQAAFGGEWPPGFSVVDDEQMKKQVRAYLRGER